MRGTDALAAALREAGCAHTPGLIAPEVCDALVAAWSAGPAQFDGLLRRQHNGRWESHERDRGGFVTNPVLNPHRLTQWPDLVRASEELLHAEPLAACARAALHGTAHLHQTALYDGSPGSSLHRDDHPYLADGAMVAVLVALQDIDEAGGPFVFYPGTHDVDAPDLDVLGRQVWEARFTRGEAPTQLDALEARVHEITTGRTAVLATLPKGDAVWWVRRTVHGSLPASPESGQGRRSFIAHFTASAPPPGREAPPG